MVIKHNFYVFFGVFYFAFLAAALPLGFVLQRLIDLDWGTIINVVCFAAAVQLSATRFGGRFVYIDGPSFIGLRARIRKNGLRIALAFSAIAMSIDLYYYALGSFYFKGEFQPLAYWRLLFIAVAYSGIGYVALKSLYTDDKKR